jgi:uncharacterized protein
MARSFLGEGWRFPIEVDDDGKFERAQYEESVRQSIWIILGTAKGERVMRPDFGCGIYDLVFEVNSPTPPPGFRMPSAMHCSSSSRAST